MSKITVGVPPNFSPLLSPQKSWEKVDCQIEQRKKHSYNITTIGPFLFLNPINKKNYPFLIFIPNYIPEPLPKKGTFCTLSIKFSKFIPSVTFSSSREDQIKEIYDYITNSKREINIFMENVKISENITSNGFDQYSENLAKPIKVIPNIQFMNGKWQLQTLYKEQAKELKTIQIETSNVIALPCYEIPHKFGSNEIAIYSFLVMSKADPLPIYFKTPEIDEMIRWILFIYAYLHNSPNAVGAPFPRIQSTPIKKISSNITSIVSNQLQSPISVNESYDEGGNNPKHLGPASNPPQGQKQKPVLCPKQSSPQIQKQQPNQSLKQSSAQVQKQPPNQGPKQPTTQGQKQQPNQIPKQPSAQAQKQQPVQNQRPKQTQFANMPQAQLNDIKRRNIDRKTTNSLYTSNRAPASQMNIRKPMPPALDSKSPTKSQTNLSQSQNQGVPKQNVKITKNPANNASQSSIPTVKIIEKKKNETNEVKINISTNANANTITSENPETSNSISNSGSINSIDDQIIIKTNQTPAQTEPEKDDFQDFSFQFESISVEDTPAKKNDIAFPSVQFIDEKNEINNDIESRSNNKEANDSQNPQSTKPNLESTTTTTTPASTGRARSFSVKRRNSSISSEALNCIRSEKSHELDNNDDYKIPPDIESRIEKTLSELDKKFTNIEKDDTEKDVFHPPDYDEIVSSTIVSMKSLAKSNSRTMQLNTLMSSIDNDIKNDVVEFPFVDSVYEKTVEDTLTNMSSEDNIDLNSFFKFSEYPDYDASQLVNSGRPRITFIDEFTRIDQGLRQSGSMNYDLNNQFVVRLCFLVACTIVNGLKEFNDQSSTISIIEPLRQLSLILTDLNPIINEISTVQTTCEQASIAATMLIKKNLLGTFLREVKRTENWAPKYYLNSAMLSSYEFIDTFVLMLEPMLNTMNFNIEASSTIFKSVSTDDANRYAFTPLFSYLEIDDLFKAGNDPVKIISKQFEIGLKKSKKFLNLSAWDVLEKLTQEQRYSAAYYAKFMSSINASKAFFGSSKSKLESWISESINSKQIHVFFMIVHINLTLLNTPDYYEESSLIDPFRANYIMKKLCKFVSRP